MQDDHKIVNFVVVFLMDLRALTCSKDNSHRCPLPNSIELEFFACHVQVLGLTFLFLFFEVKKKTKDFADVGKAVWLVIASPSYLVHHLHVE